VRVLGRALGGRGDPDQREHVHRALPRLAPRALAVHAHHLGHLVAHGEHGLSAVIGSWKIIAMRRPRMLRISASGSASRSRPSNSTRLPGSMRPGGRMRRSTDSAVTDLPHPDSPTTPTVSPAATSSDTRPPSARCPRGAEVGSQVADGEEGR
jgi:hypothetical protein